MIDRAGIKESVRTYLKGRWGRPFLAWFLVYLLLQNVSAIGAVMSYTVGFPSVLVSLLLAPFGVTMSGYFLRFARGEEPTLGTAFDFQKNYGSYLGAVSYQMLWQFLWTLLFIIPGIIKSYAYCLTPYIIYDNPKIGAQRALRLSIAITQGHKGELFILGLSFILWSLLSMITFGIANLYVMPYYNTTFATYYEKLKQTAIEQGRVNALEFYTI